MHNAMKVFLDTNVFLEYLERRRQYQAVSQLLSAIEDGRIKAVVSVGGIYTLAYLIRMELKRQDIHRPEQTMRLRQTLNTVLSMVTVVGISHKHIITGINDQAFDDVEDSLQLQSALQAKCDALVTINLRDYRNSDASKIEIISPAEFVERYF